MKKILTVVTVSLLFVIGCSVTDQNKEQAENANQTMSEKKDDKTAETPAKSVTTDDQATPQNQTDQPQVSTSSSQTSRPLSESSGNAKDNKFDELYVVPNRFPLKDKEGQDKEEQKKKVEEDSKKEKKPPQ
ncbi:hypothetical protein [Aliikangiella coralliicola]|uniref:Lipoprotein n=1 Tax=Aliikangiella coralliicola TaxID=2592383 RepID=A0A545UIH9_9GAMM|nr:hypothetical protein [Aliikangiella coralliicola]TQV89267.1 hypothetical protein FLL46_03815 [Aliikangiella coralliicola]